MVGRDAGALGDAVAAGKAHGYMVADVTDAAAIKMAADIAAEDRGPIDLLIANAGAAQSAPFAKSDAQLFRRMLDVNFWGWSTPRRRCSGRWPSAASGASSPSPRRRA